MPGQPGRASPTGTAGNLTVSAPRPSWLAAHSARGPAGWWPLGQDRPCRAGPPLGPVAVRAVRPLLDHLDLPPTGGMLEVCRVGGDAVHRPLFDAVVAGE